MQQITEAHWRDTEMKNEINVACGGVIYVVGRGHWLWRLALEFMGEAEEPE